MPTANFKNPATLKLGVLRAKAFDGEFGSDAAEEMNKFFKENPNLTKDNIYGLQVKMARTYNPETHEAETHVTAFILYDDARRRSTAATRGTQ